MAKSGSKAVIGAVLLLIAIAGYLVLNAEINSGPNPTPQPTPSGASPTPTPDLSPNGSPSATPGLTPYGTGATPFLTPIPTASGSLPTQSATPSSGSTSTPIPSDTVASPSPTVAPTPTPTSSPPVGDPSENTVIKALAHNQNSHEEAEDYVWNSSEVVSIQLNGNSITVNPAGSATVDGSKVTVTTARTYRISGTLNNGQVIVDVADDGTIRLILNGARISCSTNAPIYIAKAQKTIIILAENTDNYVSDGASYVFENAGDTEPNAAIFAKSDLTIYGNGSLEVHGNYFDGIASKDGLLIHSGAIKVNSVDDGIRGRDYIIVKNGDIDVTATGGDGLKSDNDENAARGYVFIENGNIKIISGRDAVQAKTDVLVTGGEISVTCGGGSNNIVAADSSAKGLKASVNMVIDGGTFEMDSADDALNSNWGITVNSGTFAILTADDAMHADYTITINGGEFDIAKAFEGIESAVITINNGNIHINSADDGINIAGGIDHSGVDPRPGTDNFAPGSYDLYINGGYIYVRSYLSPNIGGDGLDSNGRITMTGGTVIVEAPANFTQVAIDHNGAFNMTGGFLIGVGTVGAPGIAPAQGTSGISTQYAVMVNFRTGFYSGSNALPAGTLFSIRTGNGTEVVTFRPTAPYQSVVFSSPALRPQRTYVIDYGGTSTGTIQDGLYIGGNYTPKNTFKTFTLNNIVTTINP